VAQQAHGAVAGPPAEAVCEAAAPAESPPRLPAFESQRPVAVPLLMPAQEAAPEAPAGDTQPEAAPEGGEQRCSFDDALQPDDAAFRAPERRLTSRNNTLRPPPAYLRPPPGVSPVMFPMAFSASMPRPPQPVAAFARMAEEARRAGVPTFAAAMTWPMPYYAEPYGAMPPMFAPSPPPPAASKPLAQLCRFWAAGQCAAGATCRFWHADGSAGGWSSAALAEACFGVGAHPSFYPFAPWMAPPMPPYFAPFAPPPPAAAMPPRPAPKEPDIFAAIDDVQAAVARKAERAAVRQRRQAATPCKFFFSLEGCGRAVCRFSHDKAMPPGPADDEQA
jgi:hypothetical protein